MEVATFVDNVSQFEPGESDGMCVAFSFAQIVYMSSPGFANPHAPEDIDQLADITYQFLTGQMTEPIGITPSQLKDTLTRHGIAWKDIGTDTASIDAALSSGCPVIIQGSESDFRYAANNSSPYPWDSRPYNHCIVLSGIQSDTGYFVRDSANGLDYAPVYSKAAMNLFSAIQIVPVWIGDTMIPQGWTDANNILTASNGVQVVQGFRDYVLAHNWDQANVPQGPEYGANPVQIHAPEFGGGTRQLFLKSCLWWTAEKGVIEESLLGWELNTAYALITKLQSQPVIAIPAQLATSIDTLATSVLTIQKVADALPRT